MTIDEAIKNAEEVAIEEDKLCKRSDDASGYSRSHNEEIRTSYAKNCEKRADEHRQLAEWLKELKSLKEKDQAKAVRYDGDGDGYADGAMVYDTAFCPNCEHEFEEDSENWECEFCPNCGQRLRWEE